MPTIETGFFGLLVGLAFLFTFIGSRDRMPGTFLRVVAMGIFMVVGIMMSAGYEVAATTTTTDGATTWTESKVFIPGGEDSFWLTYIFMGMAGFNLIMFIKGAYYGS